MSGIGVGIRSGRAVRAGWKRRGLTVAVVAALVLPGMAWAQSAKERELEARIVQLEQQLQALMAQQQQQQVQLGQAQTRIEEAQTRIEAVDSKVVVAPAGKPPIQAVSLVPAAAPGTTIKIGGYVKADFMATRTGDGQLPDAAVGRALYVPSQTPVGGSASDVDYDAHAKFSRLNLGIDSVTEGGGKMGAMFEVDFFGNSLGNQNATNTYGVTLRHAYMYWNEWLAGQTWSNFMDTTAFPETVDFIGPTDGIIFVRQAQVRYTKGGFSASLENPETTLVGVASSDRGAVPDLTLRYGWKGDWGSFGVGALVRELKIDNGVTDDSRFGGGITLGGKWVLGANDDLRYQVTAGQGIARYIGLGVTGDAAVDVLAGELDATGVLAGFVGWRHAFSPKLRSNIVYARSDYDNDALLTGLGATRSVHSLRANLFYSPLPKVDVGAELMYGQRKVESGADGDITRLQFTTKYSF